MSNHISTLSKNYNFEFRYDSQLCFGLPKMPHINGKSVP